MIIKNVSFVVAGAAVFLAAASFASAQSIAVGNSSFEAPVTTAPNNYNLFPQDATGVFGAWEQFGTSFKGEYRTATYGGTLTNAPGSNGVDGVQAATISTAVNNGVFQDIADYTGSDPTKTFQLGRTYTLTVGVGRRGDSLASIGSQITLRLYYRTADGAGANVLASQSLTVSATAGVNLITGSGVLTDYSVAFTVPAGNAAIGKPIGIFFDITSPAGTTGDFALDNVRLISTVPEPTTVALLGLGAFASGAAWLRRKRA